LEKSESGATAMPPTQRSGSVGGAGSSGGQKHFNFSRNLHSDKLATGGGDLVQDIESEKPGLTRLVVRLWEDRSSGGSSRNSNGQTLRERKKNIYFSGLSFEAVDIFEALCEALTVSLLGACKLGYSLQVHLLVCKIRPSSFDCKLGYSLQVHPSFCLAIF
jgi:hypothetical protein